MSEVFIELSEDDLKKERMRMFVEGIKAQGITLEEGPVYVQNNPHRMLAMYKKHHQPWKTVDE